jgi:single-strand selective monofunctional uracil DNA glycosylase
VSRALIRVSRDLVEALAPLRVGRPVTHVYNPLVYAREPNEDYLRRYARRRPEVVLLGMNPGPFGMAQTGVPFGEVRLVRDWLGVRGRVGKPEREHPRRPVLGFDCRRSEVSGARLWGWARNAFGTPQAFFRTFFVLNYCPLVFMEASGRNLTPDKLRSPVREELFAACDGALKKSVEWLEPQWVIGVGSFAEARAREALAGLDVRVGRILHPSPQNPAANRGWAAAVRRELARCGIEIPG